MLYTFSEQNFDKQSSTMKYLSESIVHEFAGTIGSDLFYFESISQLSKHVYAQLKDKLPLTLVTQLKTRLNKSLENEIFI